MCKDGFGGSEWVHNACNLPCRLRLRMLTVSHGGWQVHPEYSCNRRGHLGENEP